MKNRDLFSNSQAGMGRLEWIERSHLFMLAALAALSGLSGLLSARDVAIGGGVMGLNVWSLRLLSDWALRKDGLRRLGRTKLVVGCLVKVSLTLSLVMALMFGLRISVHAPSLMVGVSTLLVAVLTSVFVQRFGQDGASF